MKDTNNNPITEEDFTKGESVRVEMPVEKTVKDTKNIIDDSGKLKDTSEFQRSEANRASLEKHISSREMWKRLKDYLLSVHEEYSDRNGRDYCKNCGVDHREITEAIEEILAQQKKEILSQTEQECDKKWREKVSRKIAIHKELEKQFVGSIEDIKQGRKTDNYHTFVINNLDDLLKQ